MNTKEMGVVEQALLYWRSRWRGTKVIMYIDKRAVVHALENLSICGATMNVLWRCLLLVTELDLEIDARWIPTNENGLADVLSRFDFDKITNLAPQLTSPIYNLRDRGFLTYSRQDFRPSQRTTSGGV